MVDTEFLHRVEVFRDLGYAQLKAVQELCEEVEFGSAKRIFTEGEEARNLYAVLEGEASLYWGLDRGRTAMNEQSVTTLGAGASFGWSSLVPPSRYSLSAQSGGKGCRVLRIDREALLDLFEKDPEIGYRVMSCVLEVVSARFLVLQDEVARRRGSDLMNRW